MEQVLVQDAQANRWLFSCNAQQELCYQVNQGGREILQSDISGEFDATADTEGRIHLAAQDMQGTLVYLCYNSSIWRKYPILHSKSEKPCITQIRILHDGQQVHTFYILQHDGRYILVYHTFDANGSISAPKAVAYVHPSRRYCVAPDGKQTCHLLFFDEDNTLQYRQFRLPDGSCRTDQLPVTGQVRAASAICDAGGMLHLAFLTQQKQYYTLSYCQADGQPKLLSFGMDNISALAVIATEKRIIVQWQERYNVYECSTQDGGKNFSKPNNLSATQGSGTAICRVRRAAGSMGLQVDACACIGTHPLHTDSLFSTKADPPPKMPRQQQIPQDALDALWAQLSQTQAEVTELRQIIHKLAFQQNPQTAPVPPPPEKPSKPALKTDIDPDSVGEIDQENYQLFQQMTMDEVDFSSGQTYSSFSN